jgi:Rrf2 family protein
MRLSTKTRYGARAMMELARHYEERVVSTAEIAEQQRISRKYLEQLLVALRSATLVRSVRGAHGGHALARHPARISLRQIYDALEGPEGFVPCVTCPEICDSTETCATREVWSRLFASCMEILDSTSLEDLTRSTAPGRGNGDGIPFI